MGAKARLAAVFTPLLLASCSSELHVLGTGRNMDAGSLEDTGIAVDALVVVDAAPSNDIRLSAPVPLFADNTGASDDDPSLSQDLRELYFNSKREGGRGKEDVWFATRARATDAWGAPRPAAELNSEDRETGIALSADALTVYFSSDRPNGRGGLDIYTATRSARSEPFRDVKPVTELCTAGDDLVSALDINASRLYFSRRDDDDDDYDLYVARRAANAQGFAEPTPIGSLNSDREESDAYAVSDGARILFTRSGQLVLAERSTLPDEYQIKRVLDELNSEEEERDAWASEDLRYVVFSSDRSGSFVLYESRVRE